MTLSVDYSNERLNFINAEAREVTNELRLILLEMAPRPPYPIDGCITAENLAIVRGLLNNHADPKAIIVYALESYSAEVLDLIVEYGVTEDDLLELAISFEADSCNSGYKAESRAYYATIAQFTRSYLNAAVLC